LKLSWTETGGPHVAAPVQRGFGSRLIERSARDQLGGDATVDFLPRGVVYTLNCSLDPAGAADGGNEISGPTVGPIAAG
jgi:two-component sensor histidine kinase